MRGLFMALIAAILGCFLPAGAAQADDSALSLGPGIGILTTDGTLDMPCGYGHFFTNSDQNYENGYTWHECGQQLPYYGAFAECFTPPDPTWEVCAGVFDLSVVYDDGHYLLDAYIWGDAQGIPGAVLAVVTGYDPNPIAVWPQVSRRTVEMTTPVDGPFWVGEWGEWPNGGNSSRWFIAADEAGESFGCPFTNIAPGCGYPTGWHNCNVVWADAQALGIGYHGHAPVAGTQASAARGQIASWGKVKSLYR
jgi:hypothetical protein